MKRKTYSFDLDDDPAEEPAPKGHPGLVLLFARGVPAPERVFVMLGNVATVGREPGVDLLLAGDDAVSERHARLTCQDGRLRVADLGSHNGVYVGATRVTEAELAQDDVLRFGGTFFKVTYRDAAGHADYALDGTNRADTREEAAERRRRGFAGGYGVDRLAGDLARVAKTGVTVLLEGESGTGKEVFARYVHQKSERPGAFVTVNTSAIAAGLVESELFGAVKGAYSGATQDRKGLVREAHRGTLFLDEIGDMPLEAQSKLLRVLQEREVLPVGASRPEPVDLRVVAATHRDLRRLLVEGKFRGDLYGRLSECQFVLPPLRERKEDLLPLCRALLDRHKRPDLTLSASFVGRLLLHSFPFNVRELEHVITRALALLRPGAKSLTSADLPEEIRLGTAENKAPERESGRASQPQAPVTLASPGTERSPDDAKVDEAVLRVMLERNGGNVAATAEQMGVVRQTVYRWMKELGMDAGRRR